MVPVILRTANPCSSTLDALSSQQVHRWLDKQRCLAAMLVTGEMQFHSLYIVLTKWSGTNLGQLVYKFYHTVMSVVIASRVSSFLQMVPVSAQGVHCTAMSLTYMRMIPHRHQYIKQLLRCKPFH